MRHRRQVVHVAAVSLTVLGTLSCAARVGPDGCRPKVHPKDALLTGGYRSPDKKLLYFRIAYDYDVDPLHKTAFRKAMAMWNDHSHQTKIVFEDTTTADVDFRLQRGASAHYANPEKMEEDKCSAYFSAGSYIWYSPRNMDWVMTEADVPAAARIYAHELGHALNIYDDPSDDTVMHAGDSLQACQHLASSVLPDIKDSDALKAHTCAHDVRAKWEKERAEERAKEQAREQAKQRAKDRR